jgi:uncharacterized protein (DUF305 family)
MRRSLPAAIVMAAALGLAGPAPAQTSPQQGGAMSGAGMSPAMQGMHGAHERMKRRMDEAMMRDAGAEADKAFVDMMLPHHQGAVEMGEAALPHIKDPELRQMVQKTIEQNRKEIEEMRAWQQRRR